MPLNIRKDDKSKRIALNILGAPLAGNVDSFGNKKRFVRKKAVTSKKEKDNGEGISINRFEEVGFR